MDQIARERGQRTGTKTVTVAETMRPVCEGSAPGMVRYLRTRWQHHGYPGSSETLLKLLESSYSQALASIPAAGPAPRPPAFRKSLTAQARQTLWTAVEADQQQHMAASIDAFEAGQADSWKSPVPARTLAQLARSVTAAIDQLPDAQGRILVRALVTGTHTIDSLSRMLDLPEVHGTVARCLTQLSESLAGKLAGMPGFLQALKDEADPPPAALMNPRRSEDPDQRIYELSVLGGMDAEAIAAKVGRKAEAVRESLAAKGLADGPWAQTGVMLVDMAQFTRELEKRDLTNYLEGLSRPHAGVAAPWNLINRDVKVLAFWIYHLLARIHRFTFGPGLVGPWVRARLAAMKKGTADLRAWLDEAGIGAQNLGQLDPKMKLTAALKSLCSPDSQPAGLDLARTVPARKAAAVDLTSSLLSRLKNSLARLA